MSETLHPQSAALLARLSPPPASFSPQAAREGHAAMSTWVCGPKPELARVEDLEIPQGDFADVRSPQGEVFGVEQAPAIPLRRFVPHEVSGQGGEGRDAAIVFLHGGGWLQGTLDTYDTLCRALALASGAQVFSVGYRLSPESRFPEAIIDCVRALRHVIESAPHLGVDPSRIVVAGDSAGGHLAITAARWLKAGKLAMPAGMVLIYPVADRRLDSTSAKQFGEGFYLSRAQMDWFWEQFVGEAQLPPTHPDLSPVLAEDLAGLPPAFVLTAGCDILRDEGELLARRLNEQGVPAEVLRMPGMLHGFIRFGAVIDDAQRAVEAVGATVRRWFA